MEQESANGLLHGVLHNFIIGVGPAKLIHIAHQWRITRVWPVFGGLLGGGALCISYPGRLEHKPYPYSYPSSQLIIHFCLSFISTPPFHISETYLRDIVNSCAFFFTTLRPRSVELETRPPLRTCISTTPHNNHASLHHIPLPATTQYLTTHGRICFTITHYTQHLYSPGNCNTRPRHRVALASASSTIPTTHTYTQ